MFDFATFAIMLWVFRSGPEQFRPGSVIEPPATQTQVIFVIRTRRVPFFRGHTTPASATSVAYLSTGIGISRSRTAAVDCLESARGIVTSG